MVKLEIDEKKLRRESFKEKIIICWNTILIFLEYLVREPYYEFKLLFYEIFKSEVTFLYAILILILFLYFKGVRNVLIYILIMCAVISWVYILYSSGEWKKYYREKYKIEKFK